MRNSTYTGGWFSEPLRNMQSRMHDSLAPKKTRINYAALVRGQFQPVAQQVHSQAKPTVMTRYARGPVGFLQWLAVIHPDIYAGMRKQRPELLTQAQALTAHIDAGNISGLGDWTDSIGTWATNAMGFVSNLASTYSNVKTAIAGPQIQAQLQQASQGQPPLNYGNPPSIPPVATAVSTPGIFGNTGMMIGIGAAVVLGGLVLLKRK